MWLTRLTCKKYTFLDESVLSHISISNGRNDLWFDFCKNPQQKFLVPGLTLLKFFCNSGQPSIQLSLLLYHWKLIEFGILILNIFQFSATKVVQLKRTLENFNYQEIRNNAHPTFKIIKSNIKAFDTIFNFDQFFPSCRSPWLHRHRHARLISKCILHILKWNFSSVAVRSVYE